VERLPGYDELPVRPDAPAGSSWGLWGDDDRLGTLNLLTPERVVRSARLVRRGAVFPLDWDRALPDPPLSRRPHVVHTVEGTPGVGHDDVLDRFNPQSSSQWDGFRHIGLHTAMGIPESGLEATYGADVHYNGLPSAAHGVDHWARAGIVGRAVLVDVARARALDGRPLELTAAEDVGPDELEAMLAAQGVALEPGDILLLHFGWVEWYESLDRPVREKLASVRVPRSPGLRAGRAMTRFLWDAHVAAIAADTPYVEVAPTGPGLSEDERATRFAFLHSQLLPLLGIPLGEMWDLSALAADCAADGVYECLCTSAPINVRGGVASPANAIAIK
jgi:hypothetical protein